MSALFKKLPGFKITPPGIERTVLRALPHVFLIGSLLIAVPISIVYLSASLAFPVSPRLLAAVEMYTPAAMLLHWNLVLGACIAAFIVMVMKGPAYVADAYPLDDEDQPVAHDTTRATRTRS